MVRYLRKGYCNLCGECCKPREPLTEEAREFFDQNGLPEDGQCQYLRFVDGKEICTLHTNRADHCRRFPWHPRQIEHLPRCSYTFEIIDD
jgi:hypothetical protein